MKAPSGWRKKWLVRPAGDFEPACIVVDEPEYHATGGAISTVVCEIDQGEHSDKLAAYIATLHNSNLEAKA